MLENDRNYFHLRADAELKRARSATHPKAADAHQQLAKAYLQRVAATGGAGA